MAFEGSIWGEAGVLGMEVGGGGLFAWERRGERRRDEVGVSGGEMRPVSFIFG